MCRQFFLYMLQNIPQSMCPRPQKKNDLKEQQIKKKQQEKKDLFNKMRA